MSTDQIADGDPLPPYRTFVNGSPTDQYFMTLEEAKAGRPKRLDWKVEIWNHNMKAWPTRASGN
jgi:hypothetical protein